MKLEPGAAVWVVEGSRGGDEEKLVKVSRDSVLETVTDQKVEPNYFFYAESGPMYCLGTTAFESEAQALKKAISLQESRLEKLRRAVVNHRANLGTLKQRRMQMIKGG